VLYCAKGVGALFVPIGNLMMEATGTWSTVLYTVAALDLFAAFLAIVALRPMLKAHVEASSANPAGKQGRFGLSE
jgi:dipeptide/tripeptide permease